MNYITLFIIGITILLVLLTYVIYETYVVLKAKRKSKSSRLILNAILAVIVTIFISIAILSVIYNNYYKKGFMLKQQEKCSESIETLKKSLLIRTSMGPVADLLDNKVFGFPILFSKERNIRLLLAESYRCLQKYEQAIKEYHTIIGFNSTDFDATAGIAESYLLMGNFDNAKKYYQELIKLQPKENNFMFHYQLAKAYMILLDYEKAIEYFEKASEFREKNDIIKRYIDICKKELQQR